MLARAFALVAAGALLGIAVNAARSDGVPLTSFQSPAACSAGEAAPPELEPAQASALCGRPGVIIADVRPAAAYAEGHVADAVHLPCDSAGQVAAGRVAQAQLVVVYGNSTEEARPVAVTLAQRGIQVAVIKGGFPAWNAAGLACASGGAP
jgi:rhodanese-related sulfurtransferase